MSSKAANLRYLKGITAQLRQIPKEAAIEAAMHIFKEAVELTAVDSGQAALNWKVVAHNGMPDMSAFELLWGYKDSGNIVSPTPPAGFKYSKGSNERAVKEYAIIQSVVFSNELRDSSFTRISVYNPIDVSIPGFRPGNPEKYPTNAVGEVKGSISAIEARALEFAYGQIASRYSFVRRS